MSEFTVRDVRIVHGCGADVAVFKLETGLGCVELSEFVNYDSDGEFESLERVDSNIKCHLERELCSVFDMGGKPDMMPCVDYVPFVDVVEAVEMVLRGAK